MKHYHMLSGLHGYMPDNNEPYQTEQDAKDALEYFVENCKDSDVTEDHREAIAISENGNYAEFPIDGIAHPVFGVEYAEVTDCYEPECFEDVN